MKLIAHKFRALWRASFSSESLSYLGLLLLLAAFAPFKAHAVDDQSYISHDKQPGAFPLSVAGKSVPLFISEDDFPGVIRALGDLKADIGRVTDVEPQVTVGKKVPKAKEIVLVGTLGKSPIIDQLVKNKKTGCFRHYWKMGNPSHPSSRKAHERRRSCFGYCGQR